MAKILKLFSLFLLFMLVGCGRNAYLYNGVYVTQQNTCSSDAGYVVVLHAPSASVADETISTCMTFDDARTLADKLRNDMHGHWNGE